ncbi:unnamed protein product, partial [Rotaria sp. Silwood1]
MSLTTLTIKALIKTIYSKQLILEKAFYLEKKLCHLITLVLAPLSVSQPLTDINVLLGQPGTFNLTCDAFPAPKVTWFFNDTELKNSPKHKIEAKQNVFSLTVNKCDHPDVGTYHARIDNGIDKTEHAAKLNVGGTSLSFQIDDTLLLFFFSVKPRVEAAQT